MSKSYLEPEEIDQLEETSECLRDKLLFRLLFRLGCRVSEALGIAVKDIDFDHGLVTIEHLKVRINLSCPECGTRLSKTSRFCPGCGRKVEQAVAREREHHRIRTLPLDTDTLQMIRGYIDQGGPISSDGKQLLFGITPSRAWQIVRDAATRAGLGDLVYSESGKAHHVSPHRLRDAFAVMAIKKDDSTDAIRTLQHHLGHQNINTTMRYRKVAGIEHRQWYDQLWEEDKEGDKSGSS